MAFAALQALPLVAAHRSYSWMRCAGFSLQWLLVEHRPALGAQGSVVAASKAQWLWHIGLVALGRVESS